MTDLCSFVPDDPSCQTEAPIDDDPCPYTPDDPNCQPVDGGKMGGMKMDDMEIMKSQMVFLMTAVSATMHAALRTFRYRNDAMTYYTDGDSLSTNYWKMLVQGADYFAMVFMGIASITQLLSMLGIAAEINLMVWMYGGMVDMVVSLIWGLAYMYAVEAYWSDSDSTSATAATSGNAKEYLKEDMMNMVALETGAGVGLYIHHKGWMMGQWNALSDEAKEMIWEEHEEKEDDEMDMMFSHLFRF